MTLGVSDLQSESDMDSIRNFCDVFFLRIKVHLESLHLDWKSSIVLYCNPYIKGHDCKRFSEESWRGTFQKTYFSMINDHLSQIYQVKRAQASPCRRSLASQFHICQGGNNTSMQCKKKFSLNTLTIISRRQDRRTLNARYRRIMDR